MNYQLMRFNVTVELKPGQVSVLQIEDRQLFSRVVQSLISEQGECSVEPYSLWGDKGESLSVKKRFIVCNELPNLPFKNAAFSTRLFAEIKKRMELHPEVLEGVQEMGRQIEDCFEDIGLEMFGSYCFGLEWSESLFMKAYGFQPDRSDDDSLLDNLIRFLQLCADIDLEETLVFVNLKSFLCEDELNTLYEQTFFLKQSVLLIESWTDQTCYSSEVRTIIDQDLLVR